MTPSQCSTRLWMHARASQSYCANFMAVVMYCILQDTINMVTANSSHLPYEACLIANLPTTIQLLVRDISNHFVRPLNVLLAVLSFVCNALVIITVARTKSLQRPPLLMLSSLAVTDLTFSQYSLFRIIEVLAHEHMCPSGSPEKSTMAVLCNLATLGTLATISRDRFVAVRDPWWYRNHVTKSRAFKMMSAPWLMSVVIAFVFYLSYKLEGGFKPLGQITCLLFYVICFFVITFSYLGMVCKKNPPEEVHQMRAILEREKRLAFTVALILLVLLLTFLPAVLCPIVLYVKGIKNIQAFSAFFAFSLQLNALLNPLLNFGRNKDMRRGVRDLFKGYTEVQPSTVRSVPQQHQPNQQQQLAITTAAAPQPTTTTAIQPTTAIAAATATSITTTAVEEEGI